MQEIQIAGNTVVLKAELQLWEIREPRNFEPFVIYCVFLHGSRVFHSRWKTKYTAERELKNL